MKRKKRDCESCGTKLTDADGGGVLCRGCQEKWIKGNLERPRFRSVESFDHEPGLDDDEDMFAGEENITGMGLDGDW